MKSFARNRRAKATTDVDPADVPGMLDAADLDIAPLGITQNPTTSAPSASADEFAQEAAEFTERLGDLDRFIGGGTASPVTPSGPLTPTAWTGGSPARNLPAAPIRAVAPISHPRPAEPTVARPTAPAAPEPTAAPVDAAASEAADFVERLGDLDRFIGGAPTTPAPAAPTRPATPPAADRAPVPTAGQVPDTDPEAEAREFLDRLSDLDRFIGGGGQPGA